jgi:DNA-directed RNA polymerase
LASVHLARRALPQDAVSRQKLLEESVWDVARERMRQQSEIFAQLGIDNGALKSNVLQAWMWGWHVKLVERLDAEIGDIIRTEKKWDTQLEMRQHSRGVVLLGPFLSLLDPEKLSLITILEIMHLTNGSSGLNEGTKTTRALLQIGRAVEAEYKAEMCRKNNIEIPTSGTEHNYFSHLGYRDLHARRIAARKYMEDSEEWASPWTPHLRAKVGSILVDALMKVATVERTGTIKRTGEKMFVRKKEFFRFVIADFFFKNGNATGFLSQLRVSAWPKVGRT